jgi:hypothetical protein
MSKLHPNNMTKEQLQELVNAMSCSALDLAQHLHFSLTALKYQYRKKALLRATRMAYKLTQMPYHDTDEDLAELNGITIFGKEGLTHPKLKET